jgi:hypothetical protein
MLAITAETQLEQRAISAETLARTMEIQQVASHWQKHQLEQRRWCSKHSYSTNAQQ